jgi:hypothetical protein
MEEGKRPGGLTALAIFNFVFAGNKLLGSLGTAGMIAIACNPDIQGEAADKIRRALEGAGIGINLLVIWMIGEIVNGLLLLVSGIGYLQQKRRLGRGVGNLYALLGIALTTAIMVVLPRSLGGAFHFGFMIGLVYPVLTAFFVNVTFREDFIR